MNILVSHSNIDIGFIGIKPGDWVVIKPNLIKESKENNEREWDSVITSTKIIELVCEDVCRKLKSKGKVTICDAPQTDSSFKEITKRLDLYGIADRCSSKFGVKIEILDLRNEEWTNEKGIITKRRKLTGDPMGAIVFNLGKESLMYGCLGEGRYYGADYDQRIVNSHHYRDTQEYLICATPIAADVFISLSKLKTHKKSGVTLSLKNVVGINADKNWLPHHTEGTALNGGDEYPDIGIREKIEKSAVNLARYLALKNANIGPRISKVLRRAGTAAFGEGSKVIRSGNWYGNDTVWRMVLDLNRCLLYGNPDGTLRSGNPKRYYSVIDGIIGMEGNGPMQGDRVESNVVIGGTDPVAVDMVAARVMGFDWRKIPVIREAFKLTCYPITSSRPDDVHVVSDVAEWNGRFLDIEHREFLRFRPHFGWAGHIEYGRPV
jgi:uncharacterized protein (DUF362 family)